MGDSNLTVALRIQADLQDARQQFDDFSATLADIGEAATQAGAATADTAQQIDTATDAAERRAATEARLRARFAERAQAEAQATEQTGTAAQQLDKAGISADRAAISSSKLANSYSGLVNVGRQVAASTDSTAQSTQKTDKAAAAYIQRLQQQYDILGKNRAELAAYAAQQAGYSADIQKEAAAIASRIDAWHRDEDAAKAAAKAEDQAAKGVTSHGGEASGAMKALGIESAGATREIMVLGHEVMSGNFSRIPGSLMILARQTNLLTLATTALLNPYVLAGAAVGVLGVAYYQGSEESKKFNIAIEATNNAAGLTSSSLEKLANTAHDVSGISATSAREIATTMAASGKLSGDVIAELTKSVEGYSAATGQTADQAANDLARIFSDPAQGARELNEQYHFLDLTEIQYIDTLVKEGKVQEAQLELATKLYDHAGGIATTNIGYLERAWKGLTGAIGEAWDALKSWGRDDTMADKIAKAKGDLASMESIKSNQQGSNAYVGVDANAAYSDAAIASQRKKVADLEAQGKAEEDKATAAAKKAQLVQDQTKANDAWDARAKTLENYKDKITDITKQITEQGKLLGKSQAEIDAQIATETAKLTPKTRKTGTKADPGENAYMQQQLSLSKDIAQANLAIKNTQDGVTVGVGKHTAALEEWLQYGKNAQKLTADQTEALRKQAAEADKLTKALADAQYVQSLKKRADSAGQSQMGAMQADLAAHKLGVADEAAAETQIDRIVEGDLKKLQVQYLQATGQTVEAAKAQLTEQYGDLINWMTQRGNTGGVELVQGLFNVSLAKTQLQQLQQTADQAFSEQSRQAQIISAQQQAGLISQVSAQTQLLDLHKQTADTVGQLIPQMQELAAATGDPAAIERVKNLQSQLAAVRLESDGTLQALRTGFENGLSNMLEGLATKTKTLRQAFQGLAQDIAKTLAQSASQKLSAMASDKLMGLFGGAGDDKSGSGVATSIKAASAAGAQTFNTQLGQAFTQGAQTVSQAIASAMAGQGGGGTDTSAFAGIVGNDFGSSDGGTASPLAGSIADASASGAALFGQAITMASSSGSQGMSNTLINMFMQAAQMLAMASAGGGGGGGSDTSWISTAASFAAMAFDSGGYTGDGGKYEPAGIVHKGEFVNTKEVTGQPGALPFLARFNQIGMQAISEYARLPGYAGGGPVGISAPAAPNYSAAQKSDVADQQQAQQQMGLRIVPVLDPSTIHDAMNSSGGEKVVMAIMSRKASTIRQLVKTGK